MTRDEIDAGEARRLLKYDPETGIFTRKTAPRGSLRVDDRTDRLQPRGRAAGYYYVSFGGRRYSAHRVAWLYVHGRWPEHQIDHIDGNPGNNRIANLRDVPQSINQRNRKKCSSRSGLMGVFPKQGRFMAGINVKGRQVYLGYFDTPEEAHQAYLAGKRKYHSNALP